MEGEIVLIKDKTAAGQSYKHTRVNNFREVSDGKVRSVSVKFKNPGESRFRMTTNPIHKLIMLAPIERGGRKEKM